LRGWVIGIAAEMGPAPHGKAQRLAAGPWKLQ